MRPVLPEEFLTFWYRALAQEHGLVIPVSDTAAAHNYEARLYEARDQAADPRLANLSIFKPASGDRIMIYHKHKDTLE